MQYRVPMDGDIDAKDFAMLRGKKKKKKNEDEPEGENGETANMNPKMATAKEDTDFSKAHDIVRKHSKGSEVRGSGDSTTVTAEHPKGQNATKDERMAHTNMLKDKLKHLKSVKVVHKTYPGSATEQNVKEYGMVYSNKNKKGKITPPYPAAEDHADKKKKKEVSEISFRPNDDTSLGNRYANKVMSGDYSSKKTKNREKGIATMVYKRAAQKGVPGVAKVPFTEDPAHYARIAQANARRDKEMGRPTTPNLDDPKFKMTKKDKMTKDPMNPTGAMTGYRSKMDHVEKDENMSIREKLISVVETANHGNMDSQETYDDMYKGAGAKKMRKDHQNMKVDTTRKLGVDDASKAGKAIKKAPMRNADNPKGDINIVPPGTPMKDPAASKDTALESVMAAYKSMSENKDHVMVDADVVLPKAHDNPTKGKAWAEKYGQRKGGPSMKVHSYTHDGPGGGHPAVTYKGHVKDAMKFHNHHHDENYSLDHDGHKKMTKDYGG